MQDRLLCMLNCFYFTTVYLMISLQYEGVIISARDHIYYETLKGMKYLK